jgi:carbonic anhydrase
MLARRFTALAALLVAVLMLAPPGTARDDKSHSWAYAGEHGPEHWGDLDPGFATCKTGHHQSPIDIRDAKKSDLPAIQFEYKPTALQIINNGHTIQVNYTPGSFITVAGKRYELKQFHFHHPSEEEINGKDFAMVAHLVHADAAGNLAVVAVLLEPVHQTK